MQATNKLALFSIVLIIIGVVLLFLQDTFIEMMEESEEAYEEAYYEWRKANPSVRYSKGLSFEVPRSSEEMRTAKTQYKVAENLTNISTKGAWPCIVIGGVLLIVSAILTSNQNHSSNVYTNNNL